MFENIAYVMAKHADGSIPDTPEEWLGGFGTFSIYHVLPKLIELWGLNVRTNAETKKASLNRPANDNAVVSAPVRTAWAFYPGSGSAYDWDGLIIAIVASAVGDVEPPIFYMVDEAVFFIDAAAVFAL